MKGIFITFEGNEGCGKSTHVRLLGQFLKKVGFKVYVTHEPGDNSMGKKIREMLLNPKNKNVSSCAELFLYLADRAQHVAEKILPLLEKGYIVLCDRFADATAAYQGYGRDIDLALVNAMNDMAIQKRKPDLTILMDIDVKEGLRRAKKVGPYKGDRMERQKMRFHEKVYSGYKAIAKKDPKRFQIVKVDDTIENVQDRIREMVCLKIFSARS